MDDLLLKKAWKLHRNGLFAECVLLLEPAILKYRSAPDFYRILGLSCVRSGDLQGGETYLSRCLQLDPEDRTPVLQALAAVSVRKRDYSGAVKLLLEVLDEDPDSRVAKKALEELRSVLSSPEGTGGRTSLDWQALLPKVKSNHRKTPCPQWMFWVLGALVLLPAIVAGVWWGRGLVPSLPHAQVRPGTLADLADAAKAIPAAIPSRIELSADEIRQSLEKIQNFFQDYQDSACRLEINRVLLSNASISTKEKVRTLLTFLHAPDFARPEPGADYQDVRSFPELYEGCSVNWKGVVSNLSSGTKEITFELLLGYQDGQVVEGVIPIHLKFASLLRNSQVVEVLGQVRLDQGKWGVEGTGLHIIGYRTP